MNHSFDFTAGEDGCGVARYAVGRQRVHVFVKDFKVAHQLSQLMDTIYEEGKRDQLIKTVRDVLENES
jgi:hypothetical protein